MILLKLNRCDFAVFCFYEKESVHPGLGIFHILSWFKPFRISDSCPPHTSEELLFLKKSSEAFIKHDCAQPRPVGGMEEERNLARELKHIKK